MSLPSVGSSDTTTTNPWSTSPCYSPCIPFRLLYYQGLRQLWDSDLDILFFSRSFLFISPVLVTAIVFYKFLFLARMSNYSSDTILSICRLAVPKMSLYWKYPFGGPHWISALYGWRADLVPGGCCFWKGGKSLIFRVICCCGDWRVWYILSWDLGDRCKQNLSLLRGCSVGVNDYF